jgi:AcrR family transcriptional regulator
MSSGPAARASLLAKAEQYILEHGVLDLTLTALADGIGSNRRMLLYHFSSLDELVRDAVGDILKRRELTARLAAILAGPGDLGGRLDAAWAHIAAPEQEAWHRIFFAQLGLAVEDPARYEEFLTLSRVGWPDLLQEVFEAEEVPAAETTARVLSSVWSGLQLALLSGEARPALAAAHRAAVSALVAESTRA